MNLVRLVRRLCPLEEQEDARKILAARMTASLAEVRKIADAAMDIDDPEMAVHIGFAGGELARAYARVLR